MRIGYKIDQFGWLNHPTLIAVYNLYHMNEVSIACFKDFNPRELIYKDKIVAIFKVKYKTQS